jgi:hypothetical protein
MAETQKISRVMVLWIMYRQRPWLRWAYVLGRWFRGARRLKNEGLDGTQGALYEAGIEIDWSGACPVQGEGIIDDYPCYYRSRGECWEFEVFPLGTDLKQHPWPESIWYYDECPYIWPDGGWVTAKVSEQCIRKAARMFRDRDLPRDSYGPAFGGNVAKI